MSTMKLEQAIAMARAKAFQDGDSIVIDNSKQTRKRKNNENSPVIKGKDEDASFWRQKYNDVKSLRDQAEDDLEAQLRISKEREIALENYSNLLLQKVKILENKSPESDSISEMNAKIEVQRNLLAFYEKMTAMTIKDEGGGKMVCTLKNRQTRNVTRFVITDDDNNDVNYLPTSNISLLPSWLQQEISFERSELALLPIILGEAIQSLFPNEDNDA